MVCDISCFEFNSNWCHERVSQACARNLGARMFVLNLVLNRFRERQCFVECLLAHMCVRSVDALVVSVSSALNLVLNRFVNASVCQSP